MRIFFCREWKHRHQGAAKYRTHHGCWEPCRLCPAGVLHWRGPGACFGHCWGFVISFNTFLFVENNTVESTVQNKELDLIFYPKLYFVQCAKTCGTAPLSKRVYEREIQLCFQTLVSSFLSHATILADFFLFSSHHLHHLPTTIIKYNVSPLEC